MKIFGKRIQDQSLGYFFVAPAALALILVLLFPAAITLLYSVTPERAKNFGQITVKNYLNVLQDKVFWATLSNTIVFVLSSVALHLLIGLGIALLLNANLRGTLFFRILMLLPWTLSDVVAGIIFRWMYNPIHGFLNDLLFKLQMAGEPLVWLSNPALVFPSIIITNVWRGFPFVMLILLAGLQSIPDELYEAASIDGASVFQKFKNITIPGLKKMFIVAIALDTVWEFRRFGLVKAMTEGGPGQASMVLSLYVYKQYFQFFRFEYASAIAIVMSIALLFMSLPYIFMMVKEE